jgi:hypothetical protein
MIVKSPIVLLMIITVLAACKKDSDQTPDNGGQLDDNFSVSAEAWKGDFADYPVGAEEFYELNYSHTNLPAPLDQSEKGIRISGNNHSDDLFMFIKKQVTGLKPNTTYTIRLEVELASDSPAGSVGVGGSPAESVIIKGGFTTIEPTKVIDSASNHYRMNVDKANQANSGTDVKVLGNLANGLTKTEYALIKRSAELTGKTDEQGNAWLIIGTDSGFEATTTLYYTRVKATFTPAG